MKIKLHLLLLVFLVQISSLKADEGIWLPLLLGQLNEAEMQSMGMEITAEDIYSINHSSLKDAIVHFGGFCTAEVISNKGLILTNHHCGYSAIQEHSSLENDYLKDGFWAMANADEKRNEGLYAEFIRYMEDVSVQVLEGTTPNMDPNDFNALVESNIEKVVAEKKKTTGYRIFIKPFYKGNQYFLFATERYNDVRLVGAPPSAIGKYGADTDNWMWPRHTGDFSLFRIYANKNNEPAQISDENVPYTPIKSLKVSLNGVEEGDFTMVLGFPGTTDEYLPSFAIAQTIEKINPARIEVRTKLLEQLDKRMRKSDATRIKYASKYARISNAWKKWIGQNIGLKETQALNKKRNYEKAFMEKLQDYPELWKNNQNILAQFEQLYNDVEPYAQARNYFIEVAYTGIEALNYAYGYYGLVNAIEKNSGIDKAKENLKNGRAGFYKNYEADLDKEGFIALMPLYQNNVEKDLLPQVVLEVNDWNKKADELYNNSIFTGPDAQEKLNELMSKSDKAIVKTLSKDPVFAMMSGIYESFFQKVNPGYRQYNNQIEWQLKNYMDLQMKVLTEKTFYPDANSTLRVAYGNVKGYEPKDAVAFETTTYLEGVIQKYVPGDYEFDLPKDLIDLYNKKDFGPYAAKNGKMPVCFIASNHTSGGNSGSPALNGKGELIGLNFDRAWEGTMSDINYDVSRCRNIMVDIRYVLFVIDKFAHAGYLVEEMEIAE